MGDVEQLAEECDRLAFATVNIEAQQSCIHCVQNFESTWVDSTITMHRTSGRH